jgi:predicted DNA-binding transcriptional regulator YafY
MRRADRLLRVIQLLRRHRRPVTGQVMADELEISLRTLYRDIADLITDGVPIRGEAGVGYVLGEGYDLPPLMFKVDELEAVMLGLSWVARQGDSQLRLAAQDSVAKIGAVLPPHLRPLLFEAPLTVPPNYNLTVDSVDIATMRQAIRNQNKVHMIYRDDREQKTERIIWPIGISYFDAQRIVIGWCELRVGFRHFRSDRIEQMNVLTEKYRERRASLTAKWKVERAHDDTLARNSNISPG